MMVFVLLGLMAMAFAFNYLWYKVFGTLGAGPRPPAMQQQQQVAEEQSEAEEFERERAEREEAHRAKVKADQEKKSQEVAKRVKELPGKRAAWKSQEEAKSAEDKAQAALKLAKDLLKAERREAADRRLKEIVEKYPGTDAAAEAADLLKKK